MSTYEIITLIDITNPRATRNETSALKLAQQSNFNTLCQTIGLRSNFDFNIDPKQETGAMPHDIGGKATYWHWQFDTERELTYFDDGDPVGFLKHDLNGVPIITDLDPAAFQTKGKKANTWVYEISQNE